MRVRIALALAAIGIAAALGLAGIYGIGGLKRNAPGDEACRGTVDLAQKLAPLARGDMEALALASRPLLLPDLAFADGDGLPLRLSSRRGRIVLLNLWATWCVPCRKEMPALDTLQAKLGGPDFEVLAINIDTRDKDKPRAWLKESGISRLAYFSDATSQVFHDLKGVGRAFGMPTTILLDRNGCEIGTMKGAAEWASADALALIAAAVRP